MNLHLSAHFPLIQLVVAAAGAIMIAVTPKQPWAEVGKAMLWSGAFAALFAANGSC